MEKRLVPLKPPTSLAIISNSMTPYRTALQARYAHELIHCDTYFLYTHDVSNAPWTREAPDSRRVYMFGRGENSADAPRPRFARREWRKGGQIIQFLKDKAIRNVIVEGYNDPARLRVIRWCAHRGVNCFIWADSNIRSDKSGGIKRVLKQTYIRKLDRWCSGFMVCGSLGQAYFQAYGVAPAKIFEVPYEPDYGLITLVSDSQVAETRGAFGLATDRRHLLFCGRLIPEKDPMIVARSFIKIAGDRPGWNLVFVGDGPLRPSLEVLFPPTLRNRVTFTGFQSKPDVVASILRICDVLVLPSGYEPWGVVVNEAAAAGLAMVCSANVGAAAELVRADVNGQVVPPANLDALEEALRNVTDSQNIDRYKAASMEVLADWRRRSDPVHGVQRALRLQATL